MTEEEQDVVAFSAELDVFPIILAILIVALNTLVLALVFKHENLRNQANYLLCSLALSDLLTGLVDIPLFLSCNIMREYPVCLLAENFLRMTSISTVLHLVAITVDRFLVTKYTMLYSHIVTPVRCHGIKCVIWLTSIIMAFIQLVWNDPSNSDVDEEGSKEHEIPYDIANLVLFFAIPLLVLAVLYSIIFYTIWSVRPTPHAQQRNAREWKLALVFVLMLAVYCGCWLPYFLIRLQHNLGNEFFELLPTTEYVFIYLRFLSSLLNPCIYVLGKKDFRQALRRSQAQRDENDTSIRLVRETESILQVTSSL